MNSIFLVLVVMASMHMQIGQSQMMMHSNANGHFYSVQAPSQHISFHRNYNSKIQRDPLEFQMPIRYQPMNYAALENNAAVYQNAPSAKVRRKKFSNALELSTYIPLQLTLQPNQGALRYSLSSDVSSVKFASNGLEYNF